MKLRFRLGLWGLKASTKLAKKDKRPVWLNLIKGKKEHPWVNF